jgi:hypothetical protein
VRKTHGTARFRTHICPRVGAHVRKTHGTARFFVMLTKPGLKCTARLIKQAYHVRGGSPTTVYHNSRRRLNVSSGSQVGGRACASPCSCSPAREARRGDDAKCQLLASKFRQDMGGLTSTLNPRPYHTRPNVSYWHQNFVRMWEG